MDSSNELIEQFVITNTAEILVGLLLLQQFCRVFRLGIVYSMMIEITPAAYGWRRMMPMGAIHRTADKQS